MGKIANKKKKISSRMLRKINKEKCMKRIRHQINSSDLELDHSRIEPMNPSIIMCDDSSIPRSKGLFTKKCTGDQFHPKRLAVLCERVLRKYKLLPKPVNKPKLEEPTSYTIVGGKPLRERKIKVKEDPPAPVVVKKPKTVKNVSLVKKRSISKERSKDSLDKPPKGKITEKLYFRVPAKNVSEHTITIETEPGPSRIKVEEEINLPVDTDPLGQGTAEHYTVEIKEEIFDSEVEIKVEVPEISQAPRGDIIMPILVPSRDPRQPSSSAIPTNLPTMTVICDDIQIFANNIAEQLRALPVNRALLLQLDIQSMLDNERQLIMDES